MIYLSLYFLTFLLLLNILYLESIFEINNTKSKRPRALSRLCLFMQFIDGPSAILLFDSE